MVLPPNYEYQDNALGDIQEHFIEYDKGLVKMFCGSGKSRIILQTALNQFYDYESGLVIVVFPSLALITQFRKSYLENPDWSEAFPELRYIETLSVCTEQESTTNHDEIESFLQESEQSIMCVTYASFELLTARIKNAKRDIDMIIYDEAHHVVGQQFQQFVFDNELARKQLFFTATPKNESGIVMHSDDGDGVCGPLVYEYTYFEGLQDGFLNAFDVNIDMYLENTRYSQYAAVARSILTTGNNRVLTFHTRASSTDEGTSTSVVDFCNYGEFMTAFQTVQQEEFPDSKYGQIRMTGLTANTKNRTKILQDFHDCPDDQIYVLSSCMTIGEGVDTKNANMCVFIDPKTSYVQIIQNIGRIVRKEYGVDKPHSSILIPCWVDASKYENANTVEEKDAVIRQEMNKGGNYNSILNVMSALKQEDENIFDTCLRYSHSFSPTELRHNFKRHGYTEGKPGPLLSVLSQALEKEITNQPLMEIAAENQVTIQVHTNSLESPIEYYRGGDTIINLYKEGEQYSLLTRTDKSTETIKPPKRTQRMNWNVHSNPDVQVYWNVSSAYELINKAACVTIDCVVESNLTFKDRWFLKLNELREYIKKYDRLPSCKTTKLGWWAQHQKHNYANNKEVMKQSSIRQAWEDLTNEYPHLFLSNEDQWHNTLNELREYIIQHDTLPIAKTKLGRWISNQKTNYSKNKTIMKQPQIHQAWEELMNEYPHLFLSNKQQWHNTLTELREYIKKYDRLPSCKTTKLGWWAQHQKHNYANNKEVMKQSSIRQAWEDLTNEYPHLFLSNEDQWHNTLNELREYIIQHDTLPIAKTKLGRWISNQKTNYSKNKTIMKQPQIHQAWEELMNEYPHLFLSNKQQWYIKLNELREYIIQHDTLPIAKTKLGKWLSHQKENYPKNVQVMNEQQSEQQSVRQAWEDLMSDYPHLFLSNEQQWYIKLNELREYIIQHGQLPEKRKHKIGIWLSNQKKKYTENVFIMKEQSVRQAWETLMNEYPHLFQKQIKFATVQCRDDTTLRKLVRARDQVCVISGHAQARCEVAHIKPFAKCENDQERYTIHNALLMDAGLHKLFDTYRFSINPDTCKVVVRPAQEDLGIEQYHGQIVKVSDEAKEFITLHYSVYTSTTS